MTAGRLGANAHRLGDYVDCMATGDEAAYPATLTWNEGEAEALLEARMADPSIPFHVPEPEHAQMREGAATLTPDAWSAFFAKGGYHARVASFYAPKEIVLAHLEAQLRKVDQYWNVGIALARFGADAVPLVVAQAHHVASNPAYATSWLPELQPVDAAEIAPGIARLLGEKKLEIKRLAKAWILRHPEAARAGLAHAKPAEARYVAAAIAVLDGASAATGSKAAPASHAHVGWVYYRAHQASPLVAGDLDVMKDWPGEEDPDGDALTELPKGVVASFDLELQAPDVLFSAAQNELVLLAVHGNGRSLREEHEDDELAVEVAKPIAEQGEALRFEVGSRAIALSIAYNATPAVGASVAQLDASRFDPRTPRLPATAPEKPLYEAELLVVPVANGSYEIVRSDTDRMMRVFIRKTP